MPWRETAPMKERLRFVTDWERALYSVVELWARCGIGRKTGYKWVDRYEREGPDGLREQGPGRPARLRSPLSRVRPAAGHSHRQRRAVRHQRHPRPLATQRLVDPAGPAASADPACQSSAKRRPRANASDPQGGDGAAPQ